MPRGEHPNSKKALEENRYRFDRETALKAKRNSDSVKQELKSFRQMDLEQTSPQERKEMLDKLKVMARRGNIKALELYLKIIGEDVQKVEVSGTVNNPFANITEAELRRLAGGDDE